MVHLDLPKWHINQFEPVEQSRQQALKAYCPNIYILWLKDWSATVRQEPLMMEAFGPCLPSRRQGDVFMAKVEADATI
jgi:hypothetical protein